MRLRLALIALPFAFLPAFAQPDRVTYANLCAAELGPIPVFNCLNGTVLPITVNKKSQKTTTASCDKPVQLGLHFGKQCVPFARIQELKTGKPDALTLALCRKYFDRPLIPAKGGQPAIKPENNPFFDDIAIIQHDKTTGRTCFFQSNVSSQKTDLGIDGRKVPSPSDPSATIWMSTTHIRNSVECTKCHAADPFVWSPYIAQSVDVSRWDADGRYDSNFGDLFGKQSTIFRPDNNECLTCHRFGRGPNMDANKANACNGLVHDYVRRDKPFAVKPTEYWMPPGFGTNRADFDKTFQASIAQIDRCCANPQLLECRPDIADGRIPRSDVVEIWQSNGPTCGGPGCAQRLDNNLETRSIAAGDTALYQLHRNGAIWRSSGAPCAGDSCGGWAPLDNNPAAVAIAAGADKLTQLHRDGKIWRFTGTPCGTSGCPGWEQLGNDDTVAIAMGGAQLYRLDRDGTIAVFTGRACSTSGCPGWQRLDKNPATIAIVAAPGALYQLHAGGAIWRYTGTPCQAGGCLGWQALDNNPRTTAIAAAAPAQLYQLHDDGTIWGFIGVPCTTTACPGWLMLDNDPGASAIAAAGLNLYQLRADSTLWRFTGFPCVGQSCSGWAQLDNDGKMSSIIAGGNFVYQIRQDRAPLRRAERRPRPLGMAATRTR